jgi:hypothetical protein
MATTYLHRTPGSAGNRRTWTVSAWVKFAAIGDKMMIFTGGTSGSDETVIALDDACTLRCYQWTGSYDWHYETSRLLRDPSAWYHIVVAADTTNATADDRIKIYINGTRYTGPWDSEVVPSLNQDTNIMNSDPQKIGNRPTDANYFNGVMAHVHLIDGTQYAASDFGETDATSGIWVAKTSPSVTYGTQGGFYKFASGALGTDSSGNGNTMTVSGTMTNTKDTPDNNFCTMNSIDNYYPASTFSNGNNTVLTGTTAYSANTATQLVTAGKWYWESRYDASSGSDWMCGLTGAYHNASTTLGNSAQDYGYIHTGGVRHNSSTTSTGYDALTSGTGILGTYLDLDNSKLYFGVDGVIQNSGTGISLVALSTLDFGAWSPAFGDGGGGTATASFNFGNGYFGTTAVTSAVADAGGIGEFEYDPSSGTFDGSSKDFRALCADNIATYGG